MIPEWITLVSYAGAIVSLMSVGIKIGRILQKLDYVITEVGAGSDSGSKRAPGIPSIP